MMLSRLYDRLLIALAIVAGAVLILMTASVNFEIIMRYFFIRPTKWVAEYSEYSLIFITFLAAAWVLAREGHVKIELLVNTLSPKAQQILNTITSIVGALFCGVFFWYSLRVTLETIELGKMFLKSTTVPQWPIFTAMTVGSFLLVLQFLCRAWHYAREKKAPKEEIISL